MNRLTAVIIASGLLCALAACGHDKPAPTSSSSTPVTSSPAPSTTAPAWQAKYTPAQIQAYNAAATRYDAYKQAAEPIWAAGKATPAAEALFKEYWVHPEDQYNQLKTYEQVQVKTVGIPKALSSQMTKIEYGNTQVWIRQCVDFSGTSGTQRGKPVTHAFTGPRVRTLVLSYGGQQGTQKRWLIVGEEIDEKAPCTG